MYTLLVAGIIANAIFHLRSSVLRAQDDLDRIKAGVLDRSKARVEDMGEACFYVAAYVIASPVLTAIKVSKFLLFPRGIKSKFAKEQEAAAQARAAQQEQEALAETTKAAMSLIQGWTPGEFIDTVKLLPCDCLPCKQEAKLTAGLDQAAIAWHQAADVFDAAAKLVADTAGQPWSPTPPKKRIKARVLTGPRVTTYDEEETI